MSPRKNAPTTRGKPFQAGNPGRRAGARHKVTLAVEALMLGEHEALTRKAIERALAGDMVALKLCLDRIAPARKDQPVRFNLPRVETARDAVLASSALLAAVAAGEITPDEAGRLMALLETHRAILETGELERRIEALEGTK